MRKTKDFVSHFFILSTVFLTFISIYAIWSNNARDLFVKSFESVLLMLFVSLVILVASKYMHSDEELAALQNDEQGEINSIETFKIIRKGTVSMLIGFTTILGFIGMMSIWDLFKDKTILQKSLASVSSLIFSSIVIIVVCILRSNKESFGERMKNATPGDIGKSILAVFFILWFFSLMSGLLFRGF